MFFLYALDKRIPAGRVQVVLCLWFLWKNLPFSFHTSSEMFKYFLHFANAYDSLYGQFWDVGPGDKCVFNMLQQSFPNFFSLHFTCFSPFFLTLPVKTL